MITKIRNHSDPLFIELFEAGDFDIAFGCLFMDILAEEISEDMVKDVATHH